MVKKQYLNGTLTIVYSEIKIPIQRYPPVMKRLLSFLCILLTVTTFSQQIAFEKSYNYGFAEAANCVQQTFDRGYIMAGRQGITMNVMDLMLIKTDSAGNEEWKKFYGTGANENVAHSIEQTADSGYIFHGLTCLEGKSQVPLW